MKSSDPTVMYGGNASFVEALYEDYLADPSLVSVEWRAYFDGFGAQSSDIAHAPIQRAFLDLANRKQSASAVVAQAPQTYGISALVNAYRSMGHIRAQFNPLNLRPLEQVPELEPQHYGLVDLSVQVQDGGFKGTLKEVLAQVKQTYCGSIGFEYSYLPSVEREWLRARIEANLGRRVFNADEKKRVLWKLTAADGLEKYLHQRYVGQKRFSLEGSDTLIPIMDQLIRKAGAAGVKEIVVGMAHRGRLNVLINIFGKRPADLFAEFDGKKVFEPGFAGDVKYHMGFSSDVSTAGGPMHLALAFNPSHLEIVAPVVEGSVRARQDRRGDTARNTVLALAIHGDAAVGGQGVVPETLNMAYLRGFNTGGTIHIVINNQVGFTISDPQDARSSRYCTDVAKMIDAPVFHVNGDDPEASVFATELALDYRMTFNKDVFIDLVSFRRHGHNESDEPSFTQPMMYRQIGAHPGTRAVYAAALVKDGTLSETEAVALVDEYRDLLDKGESVADAMDSNFKAENGTNWKPYLGNNWQTAYDTTLPVEQLQALGARLTSIPADFKLHRGVERVINNRKEMLDGKQRIDWGFAENLAYASLLNADYPVRLTGQDAGRGTFSHRHAALHNQATEDIPEGELYIPLQNIKAGQPRFDVIDSTLSEEAVLAFEYGYTAAEPNALVIWEAQYGDFANGAQAVIDQFISAGESKWKRLSGLVMMLPHGFEGQGPEHSSARLERYLQLCAEENMQVVVPSTPAQMFHALRRQVLRPYRKPLVIMSPKSMLRNKNSTSSIEDLTQGAFQVVIGDATATAGIDRVVVCSGKLYWELLEAREKNNLGNVALIRLEQLYPFPQDHLAAELAKYPAAQVLWTQEEPHNQGAWFTLRDDISAALAEGQVLKEISRPASASPAVGYLSKHNEQQQAIINGALGL